MTYDRIELGGRHKTHPGCSWEGFLSALRIGGISGPDHTGIIRTDGLVYE